MELSVTDSKDLQRNAVLAHLPSAEFDRLREHLEVVELKVRHTVHQPDAAIREVYFPLDSVFSLVAVADERVSVEVATIGREGMVGLPVFLGALTSPHSAFCQISGRAGKLSVERFRDVLNHDGALHRALNRLTQSMMVQIAQNVVCNSTHPAEQRAARWLLTTQDRIGQDDFDLTQEFLAQMLGVRRGTVSLTAGVLQQAGLIRYSRGRITILDAGALHEAACDCYDVIQAEHARIATRRD